MSINSLAELWKAVCEDAKNYIAEVGYNAFVKDIYPIKMQEGKLIVGIGNVFKKQAVEAYYKEILEKCCTNVMGLPLKIEITVTQNDEIGDDFVDPKKTSIESIYTFENFVVGSSNRFAHAACLAVANNPSQTYNPLFIYGSSGVGKTHLMLAIKNFLHEKRPELKVEFIRCEDFTNALIEAVRTGTTLEFHQRFRTVDVLLIDDIQFIAGKEQTQEEFFNTFNAIQQSGKQLVFTMDRPPKDVKTLDDRIRNRLEMGLFADITPPDYETRVGIIKKKAESLNIFLDDSIVHYIAEHIKMNTRQLEGVVKSLQAYIQLQGQTPTIAVVQKIIREVVNDTKPEPIKIEKIIEEVARTYDVSEKEIISKRKTAELAKARQIAMYIARETTELSYKPIGEAFGKDHTTVLYAVKKVETWLREDPHEKELIDDIIKNLKNES